MNKSSQKTIFNDRRMSTERRSGYEIDGAMPPGGNRRDRHERRKSSDLSDTPWWLQTNYVEAESFRESLEEAES